MNKSVSTNRLFALIVICVVSLLFFISIALFSSNITNAQSSIDSDLNVKIHEVLALGLTNCDGTNSTVVDIDISPNSNGVFKSNCQTLEIDTNALGYTLTAKSAGANPNYNNGDPTNNLLYLNPTTITPTPTIPSTANTIASPTTIANNTWGFAVEDRLNFQNSYTIDNQNNIYAELPTQDTTIYDTNNSTTPQTNHTFYYATKLTTATVAGTYGTTITYTAIGEPVKEAPCQSDGVICIEVTEPGTIAIQNLWNTPITYSIDGSDPISVESNTVSVDLDVSVDDIVEVKESADGVTFRSWAASNRGFVTNTTSTGTAKVSITKMPTMNRFTTDSTGTTAGNNFFSRFAGTSYRFNSAAINSLPDGSLDTSNITTVGTSFFSGFNYDGNLTSLPNDSFNTSNITTTGSDFFSDFNSYGHLSSLPDGSFNTSNITSTGDNFFSSFNYDGYLTSLPNGSFDTSNITSVGGFFFSNFNSDGNLTSLPDGSFNTNNITTTGSFFFSNFNSYGELVSLPIGSFDTSNITSVGGFFFSSFNSYGYLTSLPNGSFNTSNITTTGSDFFSDFNSYGYLTSLPNGSFNTSNITTAGYYFFSNFNYSGELTSLPEGSFNTSNITTTTLAEFFSSFNGDSDSNAGKLQAGTGVTITNKSSSAVTFWQRPLGNPDGTAFSTVVSTGGEITFLAE